MFSKILTFSVLSVFCVLTAISSVYAHDVTYVRGGVTYDHDFRHRHSVSGKGEVWHTHENVLHKAVKDDVFINDCPFGPVENPTCIGTTTEPVETDHDHFKPGYNNNHDTAIFDPTPVPAPVPTPDPTPENTQKTTPDPTQETTRETTLDPTQETTPKKVIITRQTPSQCGLGWAPQSQYQHQAELPKVMIYALEFEFTNGNYTCSAIEIRTGDATLSHLEGWQLYLGTRYNPSRLPITLTQENSQITDQILRLTPEGLGQQTLACSTLYASGQPLPSVRYELKNENNIHIDRAYSCYRWGQTTLTPEQHISPRRISSQSLQAMDPPRIERYLSDPTKVFRTYIDFAAFGWDRAVFSDWLLAASEASDIAGGNAPSSSYRQLTTSWAALKLRQTDPSHKKSR